MKNQSANVQSQKRLFNTLKKKLPYHFITPIAQNASGVTVRQIKCVFLGEITNPEIVSVVKAAALKTISQQKRLHTVAKKVKKSGK